MSLQQIKNTVKKRFQEGMQRYVDERIIDENQANEMYCAIYKKTELVDIAIQPESFICSDDKFAGFFLINSDVQFALIEKQIRFDCDQFTRHKITSDDSFDIWRVSALQREDYHDLEIGDVGGEDSWHNALVFYLK